MAKSAWTSITTMTHRAAVDMNVAGTARGKLVEVQGAAENGEGFDREQMNQLLDLALAGCKQIMENKQPRWRVD